MIKSNTFSRKLTMIILLLMLIGISNAQVKSYLKTSTGVRFMLDAGKKNICLLKDDIVEVNYSSLANLAEKKSLVVLPVRSYANNFTVSESGNEIVIATAKLKIKINCGTQAIT